MTVYVVEFGAYDLRSVWAVCRTEERAKAIVKHLLDEYGEYDQPEYSAFVLEEDKAPEAQIPLRPSWEKFVSQPTSGLLPGYTEK